MELSHEETFRRIAEYEKTDDYHYCKEQQYPLIVYTYMGKEKIIVNPLSTTIGWYRTFMAWRVILDVSSGDKEVGRAVLDSIEHIKESPVDARRPDERGENNLLGAAGCSSNSALDKKYIFCSTEYYKDGMIKVWYTENTAPEGCEPVYEEKKLILPPDSTPEEIGAAVRMSLEGRARIRKLQKQKKKEPPPRGETELLCGKSVSYPLPKDRHFVDMEDCHAAEIYQAYGYFPKEDAESETARLYFCIADDISEENIRSAWQKLYGNADELSVSAAEHELFTVRAEMRSRKIHKISYLARLDESELFECTLEVDMPAKRKKLDEKLTEMFAEFIRDCRIK